MRTKKLSVLIVDDNRYYTKRMTDLLRGLDTIKDINTAQNIKEATSILDENEHDLVLLDIQLPDGNGMNLIKPIMESQGEVIMISNSSSDFYRKQCQQLGARYFLDKTNDFDMVPALLREIHRY